LLLLNYQITSYYTTNSHPTCSPKHLGHPDLFEDERMRKKTSRVPNLADFFDEPPKKKGSGQKEGPKRGSKRSKGQARSSASKKRARGGVQIRSDDEDDDDEDDG
jgi:hypothetical protein